MSPFPFDYLTLSHQTFLELEQTRNPSRTTSGRVLKISTRQTNKQWKKEPELSSASVLEKKRVVSKSTTMCAPTQQRRQNRYANERMQMRRHQGAQRGGGGGGGGILATSRRRRLMRSLVNRAPQADAPRQPFLMKKQTTPAVAICTSWSTSSSNHPPASGGGWVSKRGGNPTGFLLTARKKNPVKPSKSREVPQSGNRQPINPTTGC